MRTTNPVLNDDTFKSFNEPAAASQAVMTVQGTVNKTLVLQGVLVVAAYWIWRLAYASGAQAVTPWVAGGAIGGLIIALVICFSMTTAPYLSAFYALAEGLVLGGLSALLEMRFPGIVIQAVALTFGTLFFL